MPTKYRLVYFDSRGLAEAARYMFAVANVPHVFEDIRLDKEKWPEFKSQQPFGKLPVLEFDGYRLSESRAIYRYLGEEFGLIGKTKLEAARCEMIIGAVADFITFRWNLYNATDDATREEVLKKVSTETAPEFFPYLQKQLKDNKTKYFVGDSLTIADLVVAVALEDLKTRIPTILDEYGDLNEHTDRIHNIPAIKKWVENRPKTPF